MREKFWMAAAFFNFLYDPNSYKFITVKQFAENHRFSPETLDYFDRVSRLTDGAGAEKFTMFNFFQILNQNVLNSLYQPREANDVQLFRLWKEALLKTGKVTFMENANVSTVATENEKVVGVNVRKGENEIFVPSAKGVIFAIPPQDLLTALEKTPSPLGTKNAFGNFEELKKWERETRYLTYIPITFHWRQRREDGRNFLELPQVHGFPKSDWGVAFIALSDYFQEIENDKILITSAISLPDRKSSVTGKTANQTRDETELKNEVFRQVNEAFGNSLPIPNEMLLSPGVFYDTRGRKYDTVDNSYVATAPTIPPLPVQSLLYGNLYSVGTHNGFSLYDFTSLESAVSNALVASSIILGKEKRKLKRPRELRPYIVILVVLFLFFAGYLLLFKK